MSDPGGGLVSAFLFDASVHRLRSRARWAGAALVVSGLLPADVVAGHPLFPWQLLPEMPPAAALALLAPLLTGLTLLLISRGVRPGLAPAVRVLAALCAGAVLVHYGDAAAAWEAISLPPAVVERPIPALLSLALTSAGVHLAFKETLRAASRWVLGAALGLALVFYLLPSGARCPDSTCSTSSSAWTTCPGGGSSWVSSSSPCSWRGRS